jgi:hypothetical protein
MNVEKTRKHPHFYRFCTSLGTVVFGRKGGEFGGIERHIAENKDVPHCAITQKTNKERNDEYPRPQREPK